MTIRLLLGVAGCVIALPAATAQQQQQQEQQPQREQQSATASAGARSDSLATMEEIRQARDQGDYRRALQQAARALRVTGQAALGYDQYELQVIRGDSLLHLNDPVTALQAYNAAAQSREPKQVGEARAMALLIRRSTDRKYRPKTSPGAAPIDIVDRSSRREAAAALLEDELTRLQDELAAAERATTLEPIFEVVEPLLDLRSLEYLATGGKGERTLQVAIDINQRAQELIAREVTRLGHRVTQMEQMASRIQDDGGSSVYRRGLISTERQELRDMIDYLNRIGRVLRNAQRIAQMQGASPEPWEALTTQTLQARDHAQNVLATE